MDKKTIMIKKIIMGVICAVVVALLVWYGIQVGIFGESNYFFDHFLACVSLVGLGVVAITLVYGEGNKFSGNRSHDTLMIFVGFGLIIAGLLSILISYIF